MRAGRAWLFLFACRSIHRARRETPSIDNRPCRRRVQRGRGTRRLQSVCAGRRENRGRELVAWSYLFTICDWRLTPAPEFRAANRKSQIVNRKWLKHPLENLLCRFARRGAEDVVVRPPKDFVIAQGRTIFREPAPHPRPGHDGIQPATQTKDRQFGFTGN